MPTDPDFLDLNPGCVTCCTLVNLSTLLWISVYWARNTAPNAKCQLSALPISTIIPETTKPKLNYFEPFMYKRL